jgi:hypothetical protein
MDGAIDGSQHWRVLVFTPGASGDNPLLSLASELKGMLPASAQRPQIEIATELATEPARLSDYADALLADRQPGDALVLFIDQFEELFTLATDGHRRRFLDFLAWVTSAPRIRVLGTLRADFLSQCAGEPILAPLFQTVFVLGPPGQAALTDMIRMPAERSGLELEPGLADEILRDAGNNPGEALPLVAFCLEELYRRTTPAHIVTLDSYHALGGLRGAIGQRANSLWDELRRTDREGLNEALSRVFEGVIQFNAGTAARRKAPRDELMAAPQPTPQLVEKLIFPGRLLLAEDTEGRATVTLAHEALLHEWPDLRNWLGLDYLALLRKGGETWNSWRAKESLIVPQLNGADLSAVDLKGVDLHGVKLNGANLMGTNLSEANLRDADLSRANLQSAGLYGANLRQADLSGANLQGADLDGANLRQADLSGANLQGASLHGADLTRADLSFAMLAETDLTSAVLSGSRCFGVSAWNVELDKDTRQDGLIITSPAEPDVTVDDLETAQFTHLLLHNEKISRVIDTVTSKIVLILGRFSVPERKAVLDALRDELRKPERGYVPVVFDFEKPSSRTTDATIALL